MGLKEQYIGGWVAGAGEAWRAGAKDGRGVV